MSNLSSELSPIEIVLATGDLSKLTNEQRIRHYQNVCESVGLNPLTKPFEYVVLNGKMVLYATKACTDQLRKIYTVTIDIVSQTTEDGVRIVTARASVPGGRVDTDVGALSVASLKGEALANALMKCITKAKRRVTLSICSLGMLDETEVESIPNAQRIDIGQDAPASPAPQALPPAVGSALEVDKPETIEALRIGLETATTTAQLGGAASLVSKARLSSEARASLRDVWLVAKKRIESGAMVVSDEAAQ